MEPDMKGIDPATPGWFLSHAAARREGYAMLASLLERPPGEPLLDLLRNLEGHEALKEELREPLDALGRAAREASPGTLEEEFNRLFVGPGNGEMVPYASWYRGKNVSAAPLARLRSDLLALGIVRQAGCCEAEDHAGVLCEIMAILSQEPEGISPAAQTRFFRSHVAPWMITFFRELTGVTNAEFYRALGSFGSSFLETESQYLGSGASLPRGLRTKEER